MNGYESHIFLIRGHRVMLDTDLAEIYGVPTFRFNEAVKRNLKRFPSDFMFQLTPKEFATLKSQNAMSKNGRGGRRTLPYAFTEHGCVMAANLLNSEQAVAMSLFVVRVFIRLREMIANNKKLAAKLAELERKIENQGGDIQTLFAAIRQLMIPPDPPRRKIGFHP